MDGNIFGVFQPDLEVFLPTRKVENCPAVIVFPGGGYTHLAFKKEGTKIAEWLNSNGVAAFVLKYRLDPAEALADAQRSLSMIRSKSEEYYIDPEKIGVIGFSAGGHLAANLVAHSSRASASDYIDSTSCRPNFVVLVYAYLGPVSEFPTPLYDSVNKENPSTFIVHATDDERVPVQQSINYYMALHKAGVPCEIHVYEKGRHGFALESNRGAVESWGNLFIDWLKTDGVLTK